MIIDLDAHQGNGHEMDFSNDSMISYLSSWCVAFLEISLIFSVLTGRVYILDMYNPGIYPSVSRLLWKLHCILWVQNFLLIPLSKQSRFFGRILCFGIMRCDSHQFLLLMQEKCHDHIILLLHCFVSFFRILRQGDILIRRLKQW